MSDATPVDLTLRRLATLEAAQASTNAHLEKMDHRFGRLEDSLGRIVVVLEAHDHRLEQIISRLDRLIDVTLRARTEDTERLTGIEGRLRDLEQRNLPERA